MADSEPIIECVVNINHADNKIFLNKLIGQINTLGANVVHIDTGKDAQRTVLTIISGLEPMRLVLHELYNSCLRDQDITSYSGNHPSAGIVDVVPFIPIRGIDMIELKKWVDRWAEQISETFGVPIVYYGQIASPKNQEYLSDIRRGGAEQAADRLKSGDLTANYGPKDSHSALGISSWTIRDYMVAYNVSLNSTELKVAKEIAKEIRSRRQKETRLQNIRVLGWLTKEYGCVQISTNLYSIKEMTMKSFFNIVVDVSRKYGVDVIGSELIGMTPLKGMADDCTSENVEKMSEYLGLSCHAPFVIRERILEYVI